MPWQEHFLRPTASNAPPCSSTLLLFGSLKLVFLSDQTPPHQPPHQPPPATCSTSTPPQHLHLRYILHEDQHESHFTILSSWIYVLFLSAECIHFFNFKQFLRDCTLLPSRFPVRRTTSTCISCLLSKIPVWEHSSPTLLPQSSTPSALYRYSTVFIIRTGMKGTCVMSPLIVWIKCIPHECS